MLYFNFYDVIKIRNKIVNYAYFQKKKRKRLNGRHAKMQFLIECSLSRYSVLTAVSGHHTHSG